METSFVADSALVQALEERSVTLQSWRGMMLFRQGESPVGLYIIRSGEAMLLLADESGNDVAQFNLGAGSIFGLPAIIVREPYTLSAVEFAAWGPLRYRRQFEASSRQPRSRVVCPICCPRGSSEVKRAVASLTGDV